MNRRAKGNRHETKTVEWFRKRGYDAEKCRVPGGRFGKVDLFGADVVAKNEEEICFVQVKANKGHIASGVRALSAGMWPAFVRRIVVHWPLRAREPEIREV